LGYLDIWNLVLCEPTFFFPLVVVDLVEGLVPEIIDKAVVPAVPVSAAAVQAAAAVVEVVTAAAEDLVEVVFFFNLTSLGRAFFPFSPSKLN
jgi:hypothetical protein